eukprot:3658231-Rhodomonas_salina.3
MHGMVNLLDLGKRKPLAVRLHSWGVKSRRSSQRLSISVDVCSRNFCKEDRCAPGIWAHIGVVKPQETVVLVQMVASFVAPVLKILPESDSTLDTSLVGFLPGYYYCGLSPTLPHFLTRYKKRLKTIGKNVDK